MRFYHIAFFLFLFTTSTYILNQLTIFGYASAGSLQHGDVSETNQTIRNLIPMGDSCGLANLFCLSWYVINGFNALLGLIGSAIFFPLMLVAWYGFPLWLAVSLQAILSFIQIAGFIEIISGRNIGA